MSENKKKNAADNLPAASGHPAAKAGEKDSLFQEWGAVHRNFLQFVT